MGSASRSSSAVAPPRRRGWTERERWRGSGRQGSPAQAGMDRSSASLGSSPRRLPRAGGDGPCGRADGRRRCRAPPRRRGWTPRRDLRARLRRGSPAQAGMDPPPTRSSPPSARLPRAGGDGPGDGQHRHRGRVAPPRRRGWTRTHRGNGRRPGGSPAQAGMDPRRADHRRASRRLPRAGGDGPYTACRRVEEAAAPPRRRGWTRSTP